MGAYTNGPMASPLDPPLEPLLAIVFMCLIEQTLEYNGRLPPLYWRYVDDTLAIIPDISTAECFLDTLKHCHASSKFTSKEWHSTFLGVQLLNAAPNIKTKGLSQAD